MFIRGYYYSIGLFIGMVLTLMAVYDLPDWAIIAVALVLFIFAKLIEDFAEEFEW